MKKVLREEIARQRKLMNLSEQLEKQLEKTFSDKVYDYVVGGLKSIFSPDEETPDSQPQSTKKVSFDMLTKNIIDNIEGGYYHPNMIKDGRLKSAGRMGNSGETMFGVDRSHGDHVNDTPEGKQFWSIIDKAGASKNWPWNYKGGNLEGRLKILVTKMFQDYYEKTSPGKLDPETKKIVDSNEGLLLHLLYSIWNGLGHYDNFATSINNEVKKGVKDPTKLLKKGLTDRKTSSNRLISDSAEKLEKILGTNLV